MNEFNAYDLVLLVDVGVIRPNPDYILPNLVIPITIIPHSRHGGSTSLIQNRPESGMEMFNFVMKVSLTEESENAKNVIIGYAKPETLQYEVSGQNKRIDFILLLDYYLLSQIEKMRETKNLYLKLDLSAQIYSKQQLGKIQEFKMFLDKIKVPKSEWVEQILPTLNYKNVALIEVPVLQFEDFKVVITEIEKAWTKFSMGEYKEVMVHCRSALDGSATRIKKARFKIVDDGRPVPDWKKFFGDSDIGDKVEKIFRSARAFTAPGAHIG